MKYLLCYDYSKHNQNYPTRLYLERFLTKTNNKFTYSKKDDYDEIIALSSEDYFAFYSHSKPSKRVSIIALNDINDFVINKKTKHVQLTPVAYSTYKNVDSLLVFDIKQTEFLKNNYGLTNTKIIPIISSIDEKFKMTNSEKSSFTSSLRIKNNSKVIVSYGNYKNKDEVKNFDSIARTNPESTFLFFGINNRDFVKSKLLESILIPTNIYYNEFIKEELYYSTIYSSDCLLLTNDLISDASIIADYMRMKKPIIATSSFLFDELLSENNVVRTNNFDELFAVLNNISKNNKVENAYNYIVNKEKNISGTTNI